MSCCPFGGRGTPPLHAADCPERPQAYDDLHPIIIAFGFLVADHERELPAMLTDVLRIEGIDEVQADAIISVVDAILTPDEGDEPLTHEDLRSSMIDLFVLGARCARRGLV